MSLLKRFDASVDNLAGKFAALVGDAPDQGATFASQVQQDGPANTFGALTRQGGSAGSMWGGLAGQGSGGGFSFGGLAGRDRAPFDMSWLSNLRDVRAGIQADIQAKNGPGTATTGSVVGNATYSGLPANVQRWANQTNSTFGDLGGWVPATMLAIMMNESGGDPAAYNKAGDAWGLFQQLHLGSNDPNVQFQSARQLAQEKLAGIQAAYAKNGISPDERTRALDFAAAWAGHFDYNTGRFNPNSYDPGVNQTAQQWADIFLRNYDTVVKGRQASAPAGGSAGLAGITPGVGGTIMQEFGHTDYSEAHPSTYAYGNAYGLEGSQHPGVDWAVPLGTRVATPLGGTVVYAGGTGYYTDTMSNADPAHSGEFMVQLANGDQLILGHLSQISVQVGQQINAGALIGLSGGSDGAHIHVEYRQRQADGSYRIIDPRTVLGQPTGGGGAQYR